MRGGLGDYTRELGLALADHGVEVHVIVPRGAREASKDPRIASKLGVHPVVDRWSWRALRSVEAVVRAVQPNVVHLQYQTATYGMHPVANVLLGWLRHRVGGIRTAVTYHDLRDPYLFPKAGPLRRWVTLLPARTAHHVVVTNREDEIRLRSARLAPTRIPIGANVHPKPVTEAMCVAWRERWGIPPRARVVGYFGFLNHSKGVEDLLHAVAMLVAQGENVHVLMMGEEVGSSDPTNLRYRDAIRRLVAELDLASRVHWTGFLPDEVLSCGFRLCDVVALPYKDGASLRRGTLQAALVHGVAIVTTEPRVPEPELSAANTLALVPRGDPVALAGAIRALLRDEGRRRELGRRAAKLARAFSWEIIAERHLALYTRQPPHAT